MNFSIKKLITSLVNIIIGSPTSILFIILGIIFSIAMIINMKKNKTIGKTLYMTGWIFIIAFIIIKYNNYISKILDNLINTIFMQIFFPNLAAYAIIIILTNIIFLYTVFNKNSNITTKLINSPFFITIMVLMVHTIDLISKNNINIYQRKEVYSNDKIVAIIEGTTLIFTLWIITLISKYILKKLIKKSDEKIKKEYEDNQNKETPTETPIKETIIPNEASTIAPPIKETTIPNEISTITPTIEKTIIPNEVSTIAPTIKETIIPNEVSIVTPTIEKTIIPNEAPTITRAIEPAIESDNNQTKEENENIPNIFDSLPTNENNNTQKDIKPIMTFPKEKHEEDIEILKL